MDNFFHLSKISLFMSNLSFHFSNHSFHLSKTLVDKLISHFISLPPFLCVSMYSMYSMYSFCATYIASIEGALGLNSEDERHETQAAEVAEDAREDRYCQVGLGRLINARNHGHRLHRRRPHRHLFTLHFIFCARRRLRVEMNFVNSFAAASAAVADAVVAMSMN